MATPRFGQDRIKGIPPLNLLDALYAQGMRVEDLSGLSGMATPDITSYLLRNGIDRNLLDRAVRMAQGEELGKLQGAKDDYSRLSEALTMRGVDIGSYRGPKDASSLASWVAPRVTNPQILKNAVATALPGYNMLGGLSITDQDRQGVTLFSNPQTTPARTSVAPGTGDTQQPGVRGQTMPNAADIAAAGGNVAAATPPKGAAPGLGAGGGGPGGGGNQRNDIPTIDDPRTWKDDRIKDFIKQNMGANAWFIDIPEVWGRLKNAVQSGKPPDQLMDVLEDTNFWRQTAGPMRAWYARTHDPSQAADVAADIADQTRFVNSVAAKLNMTLDPARASEIAEQSLRTGHATEADIDRALAAEWHYDPNTKQQAAIVGTMKDDAKQWLVPLSDQAIQTWGQGIMSGTATEDQFKEYLRNNAKSMHPQMSDLIDQHAGDPNFTLSTYADHYRQAAANTLGINPDDIDLTDPKWGRALDQIDPKTGQKRVMTMTEWDATLKSDPQYGYDKTQNAVNSAMSLATSLKSSLGF